MSTINHPPHYNSGKIEVIEALEDWKLDFHRANAVKYIARAGRKDPSKEMEDLQKAVWYLQRSIELIRAEKDKRNPVRPNDMNPQENVATLQQAMRRDYREQQKTQLIEDVLQAVDKESMLKLLIELAKP